MANLSTGYVSPQYHLVFDDLFETVFGTGNHALVFDIFNCLFDSDCKYYFYDDEFTSDAPLFHHPPPLHEVWPTKSECKAPLQDFEGHTQDQVELINKIPDEHSYLPPTLT